MSAPTVVACPKCGIEVFSLTARALFKSQTRCASPACNARFTFLSKEDPLQPGEYRIVVGFTPSDKEANRLTERAERAFLGALPLAELVKAGSDIEDFYSSMSSFYEEKGERVLSYIRSRRRAVEDKLKADDLDKKVAVFKAKKAEANQKVTKAGVQIGAYRTQVLGIIDMHLSLGSFDARRAADLKRDAEASEAGLWRTCDALKLPRLDR